MKEKKPQATQLHPLTATDTQEICSTQTRCCTPLPLIASPLLSCLRLQIYEAAKLKESTRKKNCTGEKITHHLSRDNCARKPAGLVTG